MSLPIQNPVPFRFIIPFRDMIQSLYGGKIPHDAPEILEILKMLKAFNDAGPVQIAGIEGHGGALPQYDTQNFRYPSLVAENLTDALDPSLVQRPLIRGPFGITLNAMHYDDLSWQLQRMAELGGASQGHKVVFKLFEAQNRPEEYLDSLKIITELRKQGYDVACEVAMVISDKRDLDVGHYEHVAQSLLNADFLKKNGVDPEVIAGLSLKDMIGGVKASQLRRGDKAINACNLTKTALKAMQRFCSATGQQLYLGWHTHEIGNGLDCLAEAGAVFAAECHNYPAVTEFQQDAIMGSADPAIVGDFGFVDLEKLVRRHAEKGLMPGLSAEQQEIWKGFKTKMLGLAERYQADYVDASRWSKELLEHGQLASGGLAYVENNCIAPYTRHIVKAHNVSEEQAGCILRGLFASINGLLAQDLGNAHSVTPAMKLLNDLNNNVLASLIFSPDFVQHHLDVETDWKQPLIDAVDIAVFREHYHAFCSPQAIAYFCTPMPTPVDKELLETLRGKLFDSYFPRELSGLATKKLGNSALMLKDISLTDESYRELRADLAKNLLDKEVAQKLLIDAGVDPATARDFAATHIGVNSERLNKGAQPQLEAREKAVEQLVEETGGRLARRKGLSPLQDPVPEALFSAMIPRPMTGQKIGGDVRKLAGQTYFRGKADWKNARRIYTAPNVLAPASRNPLPPRYTPEPQ